jgi:hypothetical protein
MSLPLLQLPKTKQFFRGLAADPGHTLVYADAEALEPHVCAFYSRDPGLLSLYQIGRPSNDIYIFTGAGSDQYGALFKGEGYDPTAPTKAAIKSIKTRYPDQRQVCKKIVLGCIAEGTLVRVKDHGYVPIENVVAGMLVWDGSNWVSTDGAIFKGLKPCLNFKEHWMTYDHRVLTQDGWHMAERAAAVPHVRPDETSYSWADFWAMANYIFFGRKKR